MLAKRSDPHTRVSGLIAHFAAIYDVDEEDEKLDLEPEFQYVPESCGLDRSHSEPDGWKSSFQMLRDGLSTGSVLAQFDVSHTLRSFSFWVSVVVVYGMFNITDIFLFFLVSK